MSIGAGHVITTPNSKAKLQIGELLARRAKDVNFEPEECDCRDIRDIFSADVEAVDFYPSERKGGKTVYMGVKCPNLDIQHDFSRDIQVYIALPIHPILPDIWEVKPRTINDL